jgi:tetratricopeptide (TPR) repeat protein
MNRPGAGGGGVQRPQPGGAAGGNRLGAGGGGIQNPAIANRPGQGGVRPGVGGGGIENPNIANRPGQGGVRPGAGGGGIQNPAIANRPGQGGVRPGAGGGGIENPIIANRPGQGGVRPGAGGGGIENPIIANRPGQGGVRPGAGGGGIENPFIANRPGQGGVRPGAGGGGIENPFIANRPNRPINPDNRPDRPIISNRPNVDVGNRFTQNNINNVNVNQVNQYNTQVNANRNWYNHASNWNRPSYGGLPASYWGRPWSNYHYGWRTGNWNYWSTPPAFWSGAGATAGFLSSPGDSYVYSNPYYDQSTSTTVVVPTTLDYSSPIPSPSPDQTLAAYPPEPTVADDGSLPDVSNEAPPAPSTEDAAVNDANKLFDDARVAFKASDYAKAQDLVEKAIALLPSDATLHEFRGLTLFAQQKYKEAAACLYAVLAAGPGWNWETMSGLYPNADTYTKQLRALEAYTGEHSKEADLHFLEAYHYLVLGSKDAAVQQLKEVVQLQPKDKLSAALVKALTTGDSAAAGGQPEAGARN